LALNITRKNGTKKASLAEHAEDAELNQYLEGLF